MRRRLALASLALASCVDTTLPPLGEVRLLVDTDLPVPKVIDHLRVDLYSSDGATWYESREFARLDPADWPVTFGLNDPDPARVKYVLVRLRAYPGSVVRDYRGERYAPRPSNDHPADVFAPPIPDGELPRLVSASGVDLTPSREPDPLATVDRLVRLRVVPGEVRSLAVVLRGACVATMADLADGLTCVDTDNTLVSADVTASTSLALPTTSVQGTYGEERDCTLPLRPATDLPGGIPSFDEEVCVPGGAFIMGDVSTVVAGSTSDYPQRVAVLTPFRLDKYEVTVGRYRAALRAGMHSVDSVQVNDGPLSASGSGFDACTATSAAAAREGYPLNCVTADEARAFCHFVGAELVSEAQYELAAQAVGRTYKTLYPWGSGAPTCDRAVYSRAPPSDPTRPFDCFKAGVGPQRTSASSRDVAIGSGAVDLAGSLDELMLDTAHKMSTVCWASAGPLDPVCDDAAAPNRAVRGGDWEKGVDNLNGAVRGALGKTNYVSPGIGFRCARPGE